MFNLKIIELPVKMNYHRITIENEKWGRVYHPGADLDRSLFVTVYGPVGTIPGELPCIVPHMYQTVHMHTLAHNYLYS